jgi:hypothetical protein
LCKVAFEIAIGMILGDASIYKVSREAHIKFEQGYKQKEFIEHLFSAFSLYCFMDKPSTRFIQGSKLGSQSTDCKTVKSRSLGT